MSKPKKIDGLPPRREYDDQKALVKYIKMAYGDIPMTCSIAGLMPFLQRLPRPARKLLGIIFWQMAKALGYRKGTPDIMIFEPKEVSLPAPRRGEFYAVYTKCGLFIELKREKGGKASPQQLAWQAELRDRGYEAEICTFDQAITVIDKYLQT